MWEHQYRGRRRLALAGAIQQMGERRLAKGLLHGELKGCLVKRWVGRPEKKSWWPYLSDDLKTFGISDEI